MPRPTPDDDKPLSLFVAVAPTWRIKAADKNCGDDLRENGKVIVMDADAEDIQVVNVDGDGFHIEVKVTPKKGGK
jgi:hypothetical protein